MQNCVTPELAQLSAEPALADADDPIEQNFSVDQQSPPRVNQQYLQPLKHGKQHSKHRLGGMHGQSSHHQPNGNKSYLSSSLTDADPVELRQMSMSPSMSITKMNPNHIPQQNHSMASSGHSMLNPLKMMGNGSANSLLKTANNGYQNMMMMNGGGGHKRPKGARGGMMQQSMMGGQHRKSAMDPMMAAANGFGPQSGAGTSSMSAKIMACAAMASQQMTRNGLGSHAFGLPQQMGNRKMGGKFGELFAVSTFAFFANP